VRAKTAEDRTLIELLDPIAEGQGLAIVRVRLMGGDKRRRLQIMAERPDDHDISIDECTRLSRAVSEVLDATDPIAGEYLLEVSSPGIDRPLTRLEDFETFAGLEARVELDRLVENRKRFKGVIAGVEDGNVQIDLEGEQDTALIPFAWISEAKLVLTDELMKRGAEQRKARLEADSPPASGGRQAAERPEGGANAPSTPPFGAQGAPASPHGRGENNQEEDDA
jgi:ribosome maturation factor RimP